MTTPTTTPASSLHAKLLDRIHSKKANVGVIGLGYVGLPLAVEFARHGFSVTGIDVIDIAVPTPLRKTKDPDLSYVIKAVEACAATLRRGQLVVLESTTYPGTTDEVVQPMLEDKGLRADVDFFLAFSPERVDPGNQQFNTRNIPKIVGGSGPASTEVAAALYSSAVDRVVPVSSTRVAEMVKLLENTFRAVNIGLVNEIALMSHKMR